MWYSIEGFFIACIFVEVVITKVAKYTSPSLFAYFKRFYFKLLSLV